MEPEKGITSVNGRSEEEEEGIMKISSRSEIERNRIIAQVEERDYILATRIYFYRYQQI